jgi:DNA-binding beta-propeller fold protein YncE
MKRILLVAVFFLAAGCAAPAMVYVTSSDGSLSVIDAEKLETISEFQIAGGPWGIAASDSRPRVYVANFWGRSLVGIDTKLNSIVEKIDCYFPWGVAVKPPDK